MFFVYMVMTNIVYLVAFSRNIVFSLYLLSTFLNELSSFCSTDHPYFTFSDPSFIDFTKVGI